jgi:uncharacterized protein
MQTAATLTTFIASAQTGGASPALTNAGRSPGVWMALFALRVYKAYFSFLFAGACRYEPSCSRYAYQAIGRFGAARGSWLALKRLLRCHPLSRKFGFDPVPETWGNMHSSATHQRAISVPATRAAKVRP